MGALRQEQSAKVWQIDSLQKQLDLQKDFQNKMDSKLDTIIINQITSKQFEDRLASVTKNYDEKIETAVREVHLKYGPLSDTIKWLVRSLVLLVLGQVVIIIFNLSSGA